MPAPPEQPTITGLRWRGWSVAGLAAAIVAVVWYVEVFPALLLKRDRHDSMEKIAWASREYSTQKGELPNGLADLIRDNYLAANDRCFTSALRTRTIFPDLGDSEDADFTLRKNGEKLLISMRAEVLAPLRKEWRFRWITIEHLTISVHVEDRNFVRHAEGDQKDQRRRGSPKR